MEPRLHERRSKDRIGLPHLISIDGVGCVVFVFEFVHKLRARKNGRGIAVVPGATVCRRTAMSRGHDRAPDGAKTA